MLPVLARLRKRPVDRYRVALGVAGVIATSEVIYARAHSGHALLASLLFVLWFAVAATVWFLQRRRRRRAEPAPVVVPDEPG